MGRREWPTPEGFGDGWAGAPGNREGGCDGSGGGSGYNDGEGGGSGELVGGGRLSGVVSIMGYLGWCRLGAGTSFPNEVMADEGGGLGREGSHRRWQREGTTRIYLICDEIRRPSPSGADPVAAPPPMCANPPTAAMGKTGPMPPPPSAWIPLPLHHPHAQICRWFRAMMTVATVASSVDGVGGF